MIKYRPSLTIDEIQFIIDQINWPEHPNHGDLFRKLEIFTLKAKHGITKASHVSAGKPSLEAQLGLATDDSIETLLKVPKDLLSVRQLAKVQHHRYLNDLMTPEEESEYERLNHG